LTQRVYNFDSFPSFFDGLLPEGYQLEGLLKIGKVDRNDFFGQLLAVGDDLVGIITVKEVSA
jgi:serine/threonine-protein kinase HipA